MPFFSDSEGQRNSIPKIKHSRSQLRSHLNPYEEGAYSLFLSSDTYPELFDLAFPDLKQESPTGWKTSSKGGMKYRWWRQLDSGSVESIQDWCSRFEKYVLLGLNAHIEDSFTSELDFCMALDFNYDPAADKRTLFGDAEYQLKYKDSRQHRSVLLQGLVEAVSDLPIPANFKSNYAVSCVPGPHDEASVQYTLALKLAKSLLVEFIDAELHCPKPPMKGTRVEEKIPIWQSLYDQECVVLSGDVSGKLVVIVDDLYQSGATLWMFAKYLKSIGASHIFGIPCVKSLRDSDNQ